MQKKKPVKQEAKISKAERSRLKQERIAAENKEKMTLHINIKRVLGGGNSPINRKWLISRSISIQENTVIYRASFRLRDVIATTKSMGGLLSVVGY